MVFVGLLPVIFSGLLLAAHFSRAGNDVLAIFCLLILLLLFLRRLWVPRVMQVFLIIGGIVWIFSAWHYVQMRMAVGAPWIRLLIILGLVSLFTFASALVFETQRLKKHYR